MRGLRHRFTYHAVRTRPDLLRTAIRSIHWELRLRLNLRSVQEGSAPRSMHSHVPLLRLITIGLQRGQSVLL